MGKINIIRKGSFLHKARQVFYRRPDTLKGGCSLFFSNRCPFIKKSCTAESLRARKLMVGFSTHSLFLLKMVYRLFFDTKQKVGFLFSMSLLESIKSVRPGSFSKRRQRRANLLYFYPHPHRTLTLQHV
jgi:hypothetical protein